MSARVLPVASGAVPFSDERLQVAVIDYRPTWVAEFDVLATTLGEALGDDAVGIDHIGSTSVPGLPAKDCIDVQVRVAMLDAPRTISRFSAIGFRCRPEPWNRGEFSAGMEYRKLVLPLRSVPAPATCMSGNVEVATSGTPCFFATSSVLTMALARRGGCSSNGWRSECPTCWTTDRSKRRPRTS
jgi:GrpB-like predicted nucleotidyltransferase (UPF0157 family)